MKYAFIVLAATAICSTPALADMSAGEFFARDKANNWEKPLHDPAYGTLSTAAFVPASRQKVAELIVWHTSKELGARWQPTALKLAKIESGFNCNALGPKTRHGRAEGIFQVMPKSAVAMGIDPKRLRECEYGVRAGIEHMKRCIASGVRTHRDMAACHVAGWGGWNKRLARKSEKYKQQYIRLAMR